MIITLFRTRLRTLMDIKIFAFFARLISPNPQPKSNGNMNTDYLDNLAKARELKADIPPLTALFLIMEYSYEEMLTDIKKIDSEKIISRLNVRVHQAYDLLAQQNQYIIMRESQTSTDTFEKTYCDFNTVLEITGFSRAKVETLIRKGKIRAIQDKPGEKRRFDKIEILKYREGSKK